MRVVDVKVVLHIISLDHDQKDQMISCGFIESEFDHAWEKIYEMDNILEVNLLLLDLLNEMDIEPYWIELHQNYYGEHFHWDSVKASYV